MDTTDLLGLESPLGRDGLWPGRGSLPLQASVPVKWFLSLPCGLLSTYSHLLSSACSASGGGS